MAARKGILIAVLRPPGFEGGGSAAAGVGRVLRVGGATPRCVGGSLGGLRGELAKGRRGILGAGSAIARGAPHSSACWVGSCVRGRSTAGFSRLSGCSRALELLTQGLASSGHSLRCVGAIDNQFIVLHSLLSFDIKLSMDDIAHDRGKVKVFDRLLGTPSTGEEHTGQAQVLASAWMKKDLHFFHLTIFPAHILQEGFPHIVIEPCKSYFL